MASQRPCQCYYFKYCFDFNEYIRTIEYIEDLIKLEALPNLLQPHVKTVFEALQEDFPHYKVSNNETFHLGRFTWYCWTKIFLPKLRDVHIAERIKRVIPSLRYLKFHVDFKGLLEAVRNTPSENYATANFNQFINFSTEEHMLAFIQQAQLKYQIGIRGFSHLNLEYELCPQRAREPADFMKYYATTQTYMIQKLGEMVDNHKRNLPIDSFALALEFVDSGQLERVIANFIKIKRMMYRYLLVGRQFVENLEDAHMPENNAIVNEDAANEANREPDEEEDVTENEMPPASPLQNTNRLDEHLSNFFRRYYDDALPEIYLALHNSGEDCFVNSAVNFFLGAKRIVYALRSCPNDVLEEPLKVLKELIANNPMDSSSMKELLPESFRNGHQSPLCVLELILENLPPLLLSMMSLKKLRSEQCTNRKCPKTAGIVSYPGVLKITARVGSSLVQELKNLTDEEQETRKRCDVCSEMSFIRTQQHVTFNTHLLIVNVVDFMEDTTFEIPEFGTVFNFNNSYWQIKASIIYELHPPFRQRQYFGARGHHISCRNVNRSFVITDDQHIRQFSTISTRCHPTFLLLERMTLQ